MSAGQNAKPPMVGLVMNERKFDPTPSLLCGKTATLSLGSTGGLIPMNLEKFTDRAKGFLQAAKRWRSACRTSASPPTIS
jgi:hypothetical protein